MSDLYVHLIVGDDAFLVRKEVERALAGISDFSITEMQAADLTEALGLLRTPSMFDDKRAVVIRDAEALAADGQRELIAYLEEPAASSVLVLVTSKPLPKVAAAAKKVGTVEEAGKGKRNDIFQWLREEAKARGLKLSADAAGALVEAVGEDRMALSLAIEELSIANPGGRVGAEEIAQQFQGKADAKVFGFVDAVAQRQTGDALASLHRLLDQGESPQMLFWMLTRHIRMLLLSGSGSASKISTSLGIPQWRAEKLVRQARGFSEASLVA
ncbi:MAG: DNA polymerase III subunit delta, partial [Actinobacteria bacterium]|nr:DNA polymerase III subunit delta [Actinomycetota bacterium]